MASLALAFDILARDKASKEFEKVGDAAEKTGGKAKKLGLALAGVAAAGAAGLFAVLKGGAAEFADNQKAMAQFEAGLKSTGNVAGITGAQVKKLADSIEAKTGTDGAAVVSGAALLATFTNVRNELGKGNDVFTRATKAGVDLAVRGFGTVETNAISLGKALNDPIKGITALGKQGVSFTEGQKTLIKSLVDSGNTLDAQKIILKAVEEQVGGSAEAYGKTLPGQLARARAAFDGVKETVFLAVLPAVTKLLEFVTTRMIPTFQQFADTHGPAVKQAFVDLAAFVKVNVLPVVTSLASFFVETLVPALRDVAKWVSENRAVLIPLTAAFVAYKIAVVAATAASAIAHFIQLTRAVGLLRAAQLQLNLALTANPIGLVVAAVALLVTGLVIAYQRSETFRNIVNGVFREVSQFVLGAVDKMLLAFGAFISFAAKIPGPFQDSFKRAAAGIDIMREKVQASSRELDNFGQKRASPLITLNTAAFDAHIARVEKRITNIGGVQVKIPVSATGGFVGDGPGRGGATLSRVTPILNRLGGFVTSTYRSPAENARVGGSPRSYHLDRNNPAVDIGGPTGVLDRVHAALRAVAGWRELLWRVPGHFDHIHVAHSGGTVSRDWARMPGDGPDERTARLQVGERVLSRAETAGGAGGNSYTVQTTATDPAQLVRLLKQMELLNA